MWPQPVCYKNKKAIKEAVTGLVNVPAGKTLVWLVARWSWDDGIDVVLSMSDPATF